MIFVNFKTYEEATGANALSLVKQIEEVALISQIKIVAVVQMADIKEIVASTKLEVWAQKIDGIEYGAHTGGELPEAVVESGALGTFLNHSESKFENFESLKTTLKRAQDVNLKTLVFAKDIKELKSIVDLNPMYVAYEPPELIGNSETSVAKSKPEVISEAVAVAKEKGLPLIVGAGIHNAEDVRISLQLGAVGIAVSSAIVRSKDPKKELMDLVEGFKSI